MKCKQWQTQFFMTLFLIFFHFLQSSDKWGFKEEIKSFDSKTIAVWQRLVKYLLSTKLPGRLPARLPTPSLG
jgi:hypothetical protein